MSDYKENGTLKWLRNYWFLIVFIGGIIFAYATTQAKIDNHDNSLSALEKKYEKVEIMQQDIAAIKSQNIMILELIKKK